MAKGRMKYATGIEWGAGTFTYDGAPEERAEELKQAAVNAAKDVEHPGHSE
jgi:galactose-1-phosphate uridylyltransferase